MKKILSIVLIMAMLCLAMVSCNKKDDPTEDPTPNPPAATRYTITESEWTAMCEMVNYTLELTGTQTQSVGGETETNTYGIFTKSTATATYEKYTEVDDVDEYYYVIEDGVGYDLIMEGTAVTNVYRDTEPEIDNFGSNMGFDEVAFADLTYNEATKSYDYTKTEDGATITYSFFFENGKLLKADANMSASGDGYSVQVSAKLTVSNIGTTTVTVPAFEKPAE